jgi:hypothetical protein
MKASLAAALLLFPAIALASNIVDVKVVAVHSVTHDDQSSRATMDKAMLGSHSTTRQVESFNLDTVINGQHVILSCDDYKGCESPSPGTYSAEMKREKFVRLTFTLPVSHKEVSRWYRIAGAW